MSNPMTTYFDQSAATWDNEPRRIALMKAVGEAILQEARPTNDMDILDYGCGTGLVSLFLLPHIRSVTGADNSPGMLEVLNQKIGDGHIIVSLGDLAVKTHDEQLAGATLERVSEPACD
ncbi:MAG: methyltransferase domain-containing protein [Pirellulaceae bacterium]